MLRLKWNKLKQITHHPHNEHKMYHGKPNMGKPRQKVMIMPCSFIMKYEMEIQRNVDSLWSWHGHYGLYNYYRVFFYLFSTLLSHSITLLNYGAILNTIRIKPLPFLVAQYLTSLDNHVGLELGFSHALTID